MTQIPELGPEEAAARRAELDVVDVRAAHEFEGPLGHVDGARWIPLAQIEARVDELRSQRPLLLVCRSGARSRKACEILGSLGVGPVFNLAGGMIEWNHRGLPTKQPVPTSPAAVLDALVTWVAQVDRREREAVLTALRAGLPAAAGPASVSSAPSSSSRRSFAAAMCHPISTSASPPSGAGWRSSERR
jgi:rhodanese-related sulfurtransferase